MRTLILAAGRGERMRPLTDTCPKALLQVNGRSLIEWQVQRLVAAGHPEIVINTAWLGAQIEERLGDGAAHGARIEYSHEGEALETLGGIVKARSLLGASPFAVVASDLYTEFDYRPLTEVCRRLESPDQGAIGHLVLVENPVYHPRGDMGLEADHTISLNPPLLTYASIGVFHPRMFDGLPVGAKLKLFPWAYGFLPSRQLTGERFTGVWYNVGTPEDVRIVNAALGAPATGAHEG